MGKSAKFAKRPRKAAAAGSDTATNPTSSKPTATSASNSQPLKKSSPALSKTSNNPIAKPKPTEKLGKNEISIDRPDYIDLLSGRKTFQRGVREKVLLKGVPSGTRVVSASAVAAALQSAKKAVGSASEKKGKKGGNEDEMDLS